MINFNENENDNEKQIVQLTDLDVYMDTNIQNIACLLKIMSTWYQQHLSKT